MMSETPMKDETGQTEVENEVTAEDPAEPATTTETTTTTEGGGGGGPRPDLYRSVPRRFDGSLAIKTRVAGALVGGIIGRGGETIHYIQSSCQVHISTGAKVDRETGKVETFQQWRDVTVTGPLAGITKAYCIISDRLLEKSNRPAGKELTFLFQEAHRGKIEPLLQKDTKLEQAGCKVNINKDPISVDGSPDVYNSLTLIGNNIDYPIKWICEYIAYAEAAANGQPVSEPSCVAEPTPDFSGPLNQGYPGAQSPAKAGTGWAQGGGGWASGGAGYGRGGPRGYGPDRGFGGGGRGGPYGGGGYGGGGGGGGYGGGGPRGFNEPRHDYGNPSGPRGFNHGYDMNMGRGRGGRRDFGGGGGWIEGRWGRDRGDRGKPIVRIGVPNGNVGAIMGDRGETIQRLQREHKSHITIPKKCPGYTTRLCKISGNTESIAETCVEIATLIHEDRKKDDRVNEDDQKRFTILLPPSNCRFRDPSPFGNDNIIVRRKIVDIFEGTREAFILEGDDIDDGIRLAVRFSIYMGELE